MGTTLTRIYNIVQRNLKYSDASVLTQTQKENSIKDALVEYSKRRPRKVSENLTGADSVTYSLPTSWDDDFSIIFEIEYPIGNQPKDVIDERYYYLDYTTAGQVLRFEYNEPSVGENFTVKYTKLHVFESSGATTVSIADETAIAYLSVSNICNTLSTYYSQKADESLPEVQVVQYADRVTEYNDRASKWYKKYDDLVPVGTSGVYGHIDFSNNMFWDRNED